MPPPSASSARLLRSILGLLLTTSPLLFVTSPRAQTPAAHAPASVPAGVDTAVPSPLLTETAHPDVPPKQLHEAEDAYLRGARALERNDLAAAEEAFARAAKLNPLNRDYALSLAVTREHHLTELVQHAAVARQLGHSAEADALLEQARNIDPDNAIVRQHFAPDGSVAPAPMLSITSGDPTHSTRAVDAATLAGPVELTPTPGPHTLHSRGTARDILSQLCSTFGLKASFSTSVESGRQLRLDLEDTDFATASRVAQMLTNTFAVPLQPTQVLFAKDTPEDRAELDPLVEETVYIPGATQKALTDYANLARNVFDLKVVNAVDSSGSLVLRGNPETLSRVNATFADLVDSGSDVLLDLTLYEVDKQHINDLGVALPSSIGVFPVASTAENLINANQSLLQQAIANNLITLTGNAYTDALTELGFLLASGTVSAAQFSNIIGTFGHFNGLPLAGVFVGSNTTVNALLTSSEVRILDTVQLRAHDGEDSSFRAGTRYPIETGIYSSSLGSGISSAVAGLSINGTSVSSLLSQYLGSASNVSVPQIQFEDLGLTLKATPQVLRSRDVALKLDFKIEALGSGAINTLPILNSRQLTSGVTLASGQTAILASLVNRSELRSINGLPFLSELPGFQGTEKRTEVDSTELLITLTPHIVRNKPFEVTSRRLLLARTGTPSPSRAPE